MSQLLVGKYGICKDCKQLIRFTGRYWIHVWGNPRHIATPEDYKVNAQTTDSASAAPEPEQTEAQIPADVLRKRSELAAYAHEAWSGWMRYLFSKCTEDAGGGLVIPAWAVARWTRQMSTAYKDLPADEKRSDLAEADKIMRLYLTGERARAMEG